MNREILFCGKRIDNGEWVYGDFVHSWEQMNTKPDLQIYNNMGYFDVDPDTVGQFTGLVDFETEAPIWEHDILEAQSGDNHKWVVDYDDGGFYIRKVGTEHSQKRKQQNEVDDLCVDNIAWYMLKKIGNIHDHPSLLQG